MSQLINRTNIVNRVDYYWEIMQRFDGNAKIWFEVFYLTSTTVVSIVGRKLEFGVFDTEGASYAQTYYTEKTSSYLLVYFPLTTKNVIYASVLFNIQFCYKPKIYWQLRRCRIYLLFLLILRLLLKVIINNIFLVFTFFAN